MWRIRGKLPHGEPMENLLMHVSVRIWFGARLPPALTSHTGGRWPVAGLFPCWRSGAFPTRRRVSSRAQTNGEAASAR